MNRKVRNAAKPPDSFTQVNRRNCKHGHHARTCEICEMEVTISKQQAIIDRFEKLFIDNYNYDQDLEHDLASELHKKYYPENY